MSIAFLIGLLAVGAVIAAVIGIIKDNSKE